MEQLKAAFPLSLSSAALAPQLAAYAGGCSEPQVGVRHFLSSSPPFTGIIKTRAQDFLVNEIDKQGNVLHLESLARIADDEPAAVSASSAPADAIAALSAIVGADLAAAFVAFVSAEQAKEAAWRSSFPQTRRPVAGEFIFAVELDKGRRTELHAMLKDWSPAVVSDTVDARSTAEEKKHEEAEQGEPAAAVQEADEGELSTKRQKLDEVKDAADVQMPDGASADSSSSSSSLSTSAAAATEGTAASANAPSASSSSSSASASSSMKAVRVRLVSLTSKRDMDARDERIWPKHRPLHLHFNLYKENLHDR